MQKSHDEHNRELLALLNERFINPLYLWVIDNDFCMEVTENGNPSNYPCPCITIKVYPSDEKSADLTSDPAEIAAQTIREVMKKGTTKTDRPHWSEEHQDYHLDRCLRHVLTYKLIRDGNQKPDGEEHLKLAITRLAMALTMEK